jgi:hypothetical protein
VGVTPEEKGNGCVLNGESKVRKGGTIWRSISDTSVSCDGAADAGGNWSIVNVAGDGVPSGDNIEAV